MTRSLGAGLPPALLARLSQRDLERRRSTALPFATVDAAGRPHPMLLSYAELRAYDAGTVGLVIEAGSRSARNLRERGAGTLLVIEPDAVVYVKMRAVDGPLPVAGGEAWGLGYFLLGVEEVLEDVGARGEDAARISRSLAYEPVPAPDDPRVRATLAALATPRVRA